MTQQRSANHRTNSDGINNHRSSNNSRPRSRPHQSRSAHHYRQQIRIHQDDDFSFISPCVKYSLFFFNLIFWVCKK